MIAPRLPQLSQASAGLGAIGLAFVTAAPGAADQRERLARAEPAAAGAAPSIAVPERFGPEAAPADGWRVEPGPDGLLGLRAGHLAGRDVYSPAGAPIARINDVVVLDGRVQLVLSVGGFLGVMTREIALPIEAFELRVDEVMLTRPMTREQLEAMPPYRPGVGRSVPPEQTIAEVMALLRQPPGPGAAAASSQELLSAGAAPHITGPHRGRQPEQPVGRAER